MRKNLLIVVALFLATSLSAQLYVGGKLGYGFGAQKSDLGVLMTDDAESIVWGSVGQGFAPGLKVGYFFNDNLGFELGINYFLGAKQTIADVTLTMAPSMIYTNQATAQSKQMRLLPQLVYRSDMGIYGRFGIVMPIGGSTIAHQEEYSPGANPVTTVSEVEFKGDFTIGFAGAFGYEFELSDNLGLFGELEYIGLNIRRNTSTIIMYEINGADMLPALTTSQKETVYLDELTSTSNTSSNPNFDPAKATDDLKSTSGYSTLRINFGVVYHFN